MHRKFAVSHLRAFGVGKESLELRIQQECVYLCDAFRTEKAPFNPMVTLNSAVSNIISCLIFGQRFDYHDECYQRILRLDTECIQLAGSPRAQLYNVCPWLLEYLPGPHQTIFSNYKKITDYLRGEIIKHKEDWDPSNPRDFIDNYLTEMENKKSDPEAGFNIEGLVVSCLDLIEAGTETATTTLRWGLLFIIKFPEIQEKVQAEIDREIGQSRQPCLADRVNMPYTDAVIHEIQRFGNVVPLGFPKQAVKDTTLGGYFIPKGTSMTANLSSVLHDPNEWETPDTFNPGHFLDENGQFRKRDAFLPFSAGKRACLGEQLARQELFLYFTSLLQQFTISKCPGEEPSLEGEIWFTYAPAPFRICVSSRPWPLPFLGTVFTKMDFKNMHKLADVYGKVFSLRVGSDKMIIVSGYKMVKEALITQFDSFVDRPNVPLFHKIFKGLGLTMSNGYPWRTHRKFAGIQLRTFGEGKKVLELNIQQECVYLCDAFKAEKGPFNPMATLNSAVSNTVACLTFGQRFDYHDESYQRILRLDNECVQIAGTFRAQLYNVCPWLLEYLPGPHQTMFSNYKKITDFLRGEIIKHKEAWDPSNPRDFIDNYLVEMERKKSDPEAGFNIEALVISCLDMIEAGTETSATTLRWGLLFMIKFPEIQEKVQADIDREIGQSRQPCLADRVNMPYTDAVIHEIQRFGDVVPLGFPKQVAKDTTIGGYFVPKGTSMTTNMSSVLHDPNEWETPDTFNPGHFLDENGQFRKRDAFLPFSAGKRACLGEHLARNVLFLFFTSLLQQFTISKCPGEEPSLEGKIWFTYAPAPFRICVSSR
ncbi:cytochrome P450 2J5 [Pimephales promelas]|nr:cytochrome P450 2J5 [Pimephales promelas]